MFSLKNYMYVFLGNLDCNFVRRRCLSSYSSQNVLFKQKKRCDQQKTPSFRDSNVSPLFRKETFSLESIMFQKLCRF